MYYHRKIPGSHKIVMRYRDNPLTIDDINGTQNNFIIYPNPAQEQLTIRSESKIESIKIYDLFGRLVKTIFSDNILSETINIVDLTSGIYVVNVTSEKGFSKLKFIKE
jgi:hypothetical protein